MEVWAVQSDGTIFSCRRKLNFKMKACDTGWSVRPVRDRMKDFEKK